MAPTRTGAGRPAARPPNRIPRATAAMARPRINRWGMLPSLYWGAQSAAASFAFRLVSRVSTYSGHTGSIPLRRQKIEQVHEYYHGCDPRAPDGEPHHVACRTIRNWTVGGWTPEGNRLVADTPIDERKFTDREVHEILKRAVQKAPSRAVVKSEGHSLEELKAIGAEVGIDPDRMEDAARAVTLDDGNQPNRFLGSPTILNFERRVNGEFGPEDTPEILSIIRRTMGHQGKLEEVGGTLEWGAKADSGERYVTLWSRDGTTMIRSSAHLSNMAVLTFLPAGALSIILTGAGIASFIKEGSLVGLALLVVIPVLYLILRTILSKMAASEADKLQRVVDDLARLAERAGD